MRPYFFLNGIKQLAAELAGTEHIYLGIRPHGFHAGNAIPHVIYPFLLCEETARLGKTPRFKIFVFINDWEQDKLAGPDIKTYPFNIFPLNTTFQYAISPDNPAVNIVDFWQPVITHYVSSTHKHFPGTSITAIRNSEMKTNPVMKRCLLYTLRHPQNIAQILRQHTKHRLLERPLAFAVAVCPQCKQAKGETAVESDDKIIHHCQHCGKTSLGPYAFFDYWFYHKPLAIPRLEICDIDLCITGMDHYDEGDFTVRQELIKLFNSRAKSPKTLYTSLLLGKDNQPMSKSRDNAEMVEIQTLFELINLHPNTPQIQLPTEVTSFNMSATIIEDPLRPTF